MRRLSLTPILLVLLVPSASAELVGHWMFNDLSDLTGNFPDLALKGDADLDNGMLDVNGAGTSATGWAVTDGEYTGPQITDKTLAAWFTLQALEDGAKAGSVITIDRQSGDHFDGIIFAERQANRWMNGSSGFQRTMDFNPGFAETQTDELIMMAITYEHLGGGQLRVTGYRNGEEIGQYDDDQASSWESGDAEIFFGLRHGSVNGGPGGLDALIDEAQIYNNVLSQEEIAALVTREPPHAPGDADRDGNVDIDDYILIRSNLFREDPFGEPFLGDITNDSFVDLEDFYDWKGNFPGGVAAAEAAIAALGIPEPTTFVLFAVGVTLLFAKNRSRGGKA